MNWLGFPIAKPRGLHTIVKSYLDRNSFCFNRSFLFTLGYKVLLMKQNKQSPLETLTDIKQLMERSSRFISLSGLSGVFAGLYALAGAYAAYKYLGLTGAGYYSGRMLVDKSLHEGDTIGFLALDAALILVLAIGTGIFLTTRKARKDGNSILDATARKLLVNLFIR